MVFTSESAASSSQLDRPTARVALSAVVSGALLALASGVVAVLVGAATLATAAKYGHRLGGSSGTSWALGIGFGICFGTFIGGRFAAITARAVVRRDGLLAGLLTWALLVLIGVVASGIAVAVRRPALPEAAILSELLWRVVFVLFGALLAALFGGARGARAEARAIGLRAVRPPTFRPYAAAMAAPDDLEAYERGFFADPPDPQVAGASFSS